MWITNQALVVYVLEIIITLYRKTKLDWDSYLPIESYAEAGGHCVFIMTLIVVALNNVAYTKVGNTTTLAYKYNIAFVPNDHWSEIGEVKAYHSISLC